MTGWSARRTTPPCGPRSGSCACYSTFFGPESAVALSDGFDGGHGLVTVDFWLWALEAGLLSSDDDEDCATVS